MVEILNENIVPCAKDLVGELIFLAVFCVLAFIVILFYKYKI